MLKIKAMSFGQLASLYFPANSVSSARRKLSDWIRQNIGLYNALQGLGWETGTRKLTPKMVLLMMQHLGEP